MKFSFHPACPFFSGSTGACSPIGDVGSAPGSRSTITLPTFSLPMIFPLAAGASARARAAAHLHRSATKRQYPVARFGIAAQADGEFGHRGLARLRLRRRHQPQRLGVNCLVLQQQIPQRLQDDSVVLEDLHGPQPLLLDDLADALVDRRQSRRR